MEAAASTVDDIIPSAAPEGDHNLKGAHGCVTTQNLQTPYEADTVVYGTMFTVQTHDDPISMLTMEISANPISSDMDVEIYTKLGDFKGAISDPLQWRQIVDTSVTHAREGRGTIIPMEKFESFTMNPNELRSFFISLKTSDLRYRRADDLETGQPFVSDGYLSLNVGIGLAQYGFGNKFFPSRVFSGIFHYTYSTDCDAPSSTTLVTYSFHARPKGRGASKTEIVEELHKTVGRVVRGILKDMSNLRDEHKIGVENIDTVISISEQGTLKNLTSREVYQLFLTHGLGFSEKCTVKRWRSCISIDSKITLSHKNTISPGNLKYLLLQNAPEVKRQAQQSTIQVEYAGFQPLQTSIFVAFKGIPAGVPMDGAQKLFVEQATTDYLDQQTVGLSNAMVIGTKITNQRGRGFDQRRIRSLQEDSAEDDWVEFSIDVLGMLLPHYVGNADFGDIVDDAFRYDRKGYIEDLKTGRNLPGSQVQGERGDYFLDISNISTRSCSSTNLIGQLIALHTLVSSRLLHQAPRYLACRKQSSFYFASDVLLPMRGGSGNSSLGHQEKKVLTAGVTYSSIPANIIAMENQSLPCSEEPMAQSRSRRVCNLIPRSQNATSQALNEPYKREKPEISRPGERRLEKSHGDTRSSGSSYSRCK